MKKDVTTMSNISLILLRIKANALLVRDSPDNYQLKCMRFVSVFFLRISQNILKFSKSLKFHPFTQKIPTVLTKNLLFSKFSAPENILLVCEIHTNKTLHLCFFCVTVVLKRD